MNLVDNDVPFGIIMMILLQSFTLANGSCPSQNYYATTSTGYLSHRYYSNNEDCTFYISPSSLFANSLFLYDNDDYFLEVRWSSFDVKGKMPRCNEDYVEVFLTRSQKSIGKFCSDNFHSTPFRMYSYDRRIKIKFKSDGSKTGSGFQLSYQLRRKSSYYLGTSSCSNGYNSARSGYLYSPKYPTTYSYGSDCTYKISAYSGKVVKIVFMDIDLKYYGGSSFLCTSLDDYVDVKGTDTSYYDYYSSSTVRDKICTNSSIVTVTTRKNYVFVKFHRNVVSSSATRRGFVAGYVIYDDPLSSTDSTLNEEIPGRPLSSLPVGAIVGNVVAVIISIGIVALCCIRRRRPGAVLLHNQPNTASHVTITTTTASTAAADQYPEQVIGYPNQPQQQVPYSSADFLAQLPPPYSQADSYPTPVNPQAYQPYPSMEMKDNPPMQHSSPYPPPQAIPSYAPQPQDASAYSTQPLSQGYAPYPSAPPPSYSPSSGARYGMLPPTA